MTDTPDAPTPPAAKPVAPRRRTARKTTAAKPTAAKTVGAAKTPATSAAAPKRATPAKPRSTTRATPAPKRRAPVKATVDAPARTGSKWGKAAVVGGIAAVGAAATAALLSLRGSTPKEDTSKPAQGGAHTADGTDASKSFEAGIADENSIPDKA